MSNKDAIVKSLKSALTPMIIFLIFIFIIYGKKAFENLEWFYIIGITVFNYFYTLYEIKKDG
ncbi:hypothetical protein K144316041_p10140 (plasmid) [Clostridium tetani]|uniref:hypothetical protein n=1 Tax=Clostridium tetani TaxID=1513 RepID=UPI00100B3D0C|nr:hypothetical protein [Clostridium tetani]RXI50381.1 hypothetical protein DP122_12790 [Clostridium tetani]RXI52610.1 hypothetical protein DP124_08485 [Clostridium tetani]RXM72361.1 hypothetical protein DP139_01475 [Clostridium tetani]BDR68520.1 hypothetical protein K144312032_p10100 [Clostridium tetani]BDR74086.1 hypothetical protein K144316041_p10140 [Clostridium tetani]